VFNDLRIAKRISFGERYNMDFIADSVQPANVYNVAAVNPLFTSAGQARPLRSAPVPVCAETELVESERARTVRSELGICQLDLSREGRICGAWAIGLC